VIRRLAGIVVRPKATLVQLARRPAWADTWLLVLTIWAALAGSLLSTAVGQQALVDEQVRVVETFGGAVSDADYAGIQARPPWWIYFTSGGRLLLTPEVTLAVAAVVWLVARRDGAATTFAHGLAVAVHASVVLLVGQIVATPLHYVRESMSSPLNMATMLPLMEEGTLPARFFGSLDLFAVWWAALIARGLSALTGRRVARYAVPIAAAYLGFAAVMAATIAALGGN